MGTADFKNQGGEFGGLIETLHSPAHMAAARRAVSSRGPMDPPSRPSPQDDGAGTGSGEIGRNFAHDFPSANRSTGSFATAMHRAAEAVVATPSPPPPRA